MKAQFIPSLVAVLISFANQTYSQVINWQRMETGQKHIAHINAGWDYATSFGVGYSNKLNTSIPVLLDVQFSLPAGEFLFDDFKTKLGGQVRVLHAGNFMTAVGVRGIYRRHETDLVRLQNFGSEFMLSAGYYKSKWFVAGEFVFDKAVVTHFRHSDMMKEYYPEVKDGWYIPTGGNFAFGIQTGYSARNLDLTLKFGRIANQYFTSSIMVPYYLQLGLNRRF